MKGAAFTMSAISVAAECPIDMMMYYDTRPSAFCGVFDYYSYEKLKGYYPLYWYGMFYDEGMREVKPDKAHKDIYTLCGVDANGKALAIITHYSDNDKAHAKNVEIDFLEKGKYKVYYLDNEHDPETPIKTDKLNFKMDVNTCVLIKEI